MPTLQDLKNRPSKKIVLPSSKPKDQAWVEVYTEPLTDDIVFLSKYQDDKEMATVASIFRVLKDWNFTEKDGTKTPVTIDNVRRLSINDLAAIIEESKIDKKFESLARLNTPKKKELMLYFSAEAEVEAGKDVSLPPAPLELIFLRYREHFHLTWQQFLDTPWEIISQDLEILDIEGDIKRKKQSSKR